MITPCQKMCFIDPGTNSCSGCNRTIDEVREWMTYTNEKRLLIMERLGYGKRDCWEERMRRYDHG